VKAFVLTPLAARDLNEIWDYLASDSIEAADRVLDALEKALYGLAKNPGTGHSREDLADRRHRFFLVYSYLIVYRPETKPMQVIRVLHASRDIQTLLDFPSEVP
jgi:toxin ParE1/3/4